jgi:hypothetical protein
MSGYRLAEAGVEMESVSTGDAARRPATIASALISAAPNTALSDASSWIVT